MAATCFVPVWVHYTNLIWVILSVCVSMCWYLSLKCTAGYDRKGGSLTSFKSHWTKHIAEHSTVETLCYHCLSGWKHVTLCKIKLPTRLPFKPCTRAICAKAGFALCSFITIWEQVFKQVQPLKIEKYCLARLIKGCILYAMKQWQQVCVSNLFVLRLLYLQQYAWADGWLNHREPNN